MDYKEEIFRTLKASTVDHIINLLMIKFQWTFDKENLAFKDKDGKEISWDEFETFDLYPTLIYAGDEFVGFSLWGDGTLEILDSEGESSNWADFELEVLCGLLELLCDTFKN